MAIHLTKLGIKSFRQFKDVVFDFTDPKTGLPLEKVCFVGGNGTGKTTVLAILRDFFEESNGAFWNSKIVAEFRVGKQHLVKRLGPDLLLPSENSSLDREDFEQLVSTVNPLNLVSGQESELVRACIEDLKDSLSVWCPPDSEQAGGGRGPEEYVGANLSTALKRLDSADNSLTVGQSQTENFWIEVIASVKRREKALLEFQQLPGNQERTIRSINEEFQIANPDILRELAGFWQPLLSRAGLFFDYEKASRPVQLTDQLKAYVCLEKTGEKVPYHLLSTGIRNFMFKLGHIFTVFESCSDRESFLFVDEPENSLHPDFLYDLVDFYQRAAPKAQLFMATHNPIVAAQFRPEERFILSFDDDYNVKVTQGVSPEGDDPNDVLRKDFEVRSIYGKKGLEAWERFKELERSIKSGETKDSDQISEFMNLGSTYNFPVSQ